MRSNMTHLVVSLVVAWAACRAPDGDAGEPMRPKPSELQKLQRAADTAAPSWASAFKHAPRWDATRRALVIDLEVSPGFHAYTQGETIGKPLLFELSPTSALKLVGEVVYPKGTVKELPVGRSVIVEGKAELVAVVADPAPGKSVAGTFRYQVCTAEACDRPRTVDVAVAVP